MENNNQLYYSTTKRIIELIETKGYTSKWKNWQPGEFTPRPDLDKIIDGYCKSQGIKITHTDNEEKQGIPFYDGNTESIFIPDIKTDTNKYYSVIFHELSHSTGMEKRLNRDSFNNPFIAMFMEGAEEIIAELSACFICLSFGIDSFKNNLAYIRDWCENEDWTPQVINKLMPQAIESANYILNNK